MGEISRLMRLKTKLFAVKLRRILKFSPCKLYKTFLGAFHVFFASKNEAVCREIQTHFGSSPPARFIGPKTQKIRSWFCEKTFDGYSTGTLLNV